MRKTIIHLWLKESQQRVINQNYDECYLLKSYEQPFSVYENCKVNIFDQPSLYLS